MPKNVKCKNCNNLANHWCERVIDSPDEDMERDCQYFWDRTNGDVIRSMTDEELGKLFYGFCDNSKRCYFCPLYHLPCAGILANEDEWQEFMKQPAEVE